MNFENQGKNLMYVIENHILKKILLKKLKNQKNLKIISEPASKIDEKKSVVFFKQKMISYDLIILCVGKKSRLTEKLVGKRSSTVTSAHEDGKPQDPNSAKMMQGM